MSVVVKIQVSRNRMLKSDVEIERLFSEICAAIAHVVTSNVEPLQEKDVVAELDYFPALTSGRLPLEVEVGATHIPGWGDENKQAAIIEHMRQAIASVLESQAIDWKASIWLRLTSGGHAVTSDD